MKKTIKKVVLTILLTAIMLTSFGFPTAGVNAQASFATGVRVIETNAKKDVGEVYPQGSLYGTSITIKNAGDFDYQLKDTSNIPFKFRGLTRVTEVPDIKVPYGDVFYERPSYVQKYVEDKPMSYWRSECNAAPWIAKPLIPYQINKDGLMIPQVAPPTGYYINPGTIMPMHTGELALAYMVNNEDVTRNDKLTHFDVAGLPTMPLRAGDTFMSSVYQHMIPVPKGNEQIKVKKEKNTVSNEILDNYYVEQSDLDQYKDKKVVRRGDLGIVGTFYKYKDIYNYDKPENKAKLDEKITLVNITGMGMRYSSFRELVMTRDGYDKKVVTNVTVMGDQIHFGKYHYGRYTWPIGMITNTGASLCLTDSQNPTYESYTTEYIGPNSFEDYLTGKPIKFTWKYDTVEPDKVPTKVMPRLHGQIITKIFYDFGVKDTLYYVDVYLPIAEERVGELETAYVLPRYMGELAEAHRTRKYFPMWNAYKLGANIAAEYEEVTYHTNYWRIWRIIHANRIVDRSLEEKYNFKMYFDDLEKMPKVPTENTSDAVKNYPDEVTW